jgi:hypothetical protein
VSNTVIQGNYIGTSAAGTPLTGMQGVGINLSGTREYNRSFVLMQYFGYLRRDPDPGGYQFWLNILNSQQQGQSAAHGMVCAFITSAEYQDRFSAVHIHTNADCGP